MGSEISRVEIYDQTYLVYIVVGAPYLIQLENQARYASIAAVMQAFNILLGKTIDRIERVYMLDVWFISSTYMEGRDVL